MNIQQKEHYELMEIFERTAGKGLNITREPKSLWADKIIYANGETNKLFLAFREGYACGIAGQL